MPSPQLERNPFILMLDPQAVLSQIEQSERLERLQRRICRPLDKQQWGPMLADGPQAADRAIDEEPDLIEVDGELPDAADAAAPSHLT